MPFALPVGVAVLYEDSAGAGFLDGGFACRLPDQRSYGCCGGRPWPGAEGGAKARSKDPGIGPLQAKRDSGRFDTLGLY